MAKPVATSTIATVAHHQRFASTDTSASTLIDDVDNMAYPSKAKATQFGTTVNEGFSTDTFTHDVEQQSFEKSRGRYDLPRYWVFNVYRRLFSICFFGNLIAFCLFMRYDRSKTKFVTAAAINLLICGLARQPLVVNAFFLYGCKVPRSAPLWVRRQSSKIFHFAGVHSGCGVASAMWYSAFVGLATHEVTRVPGPVAGKIVAKLTIAWLILVMLLAIIVSAYPNIRRSYHDWFERMHRFSGWASILMFWAFLLLDASQHVPMGAYLVRSPAFWIVTILTFAILQPWLLLRKVPVNCEVLSKHAVRLHFNHRDIDFGQGLSLAKHPLKDWHSFAGFPDRFDTPNSKFSMVVSRAGDWTGDLIENPPTHVWKRGVPAYGFGYVMRMMHKMIVVTTGSGIGPCLSYLGDDNRPAMRVVWQTPDPKKTYGDRLMGLIKRLDPDPVVFNTSIKGPNSQKKTIPELVPIVIKMYREFDAEAVCVISNPAFTKQMVYELERRGVFAVGPIFDS